MLISGFVAASNSNVLAGSLFEFVKRPSRVSVAVLGDVTIAAGNLYTFQVADNVIVSNGQVWPDTVNTATSFIVGIKFPDHFLIQNEPALAGDRLVLSVTRATGNILWAVQITEVA
jgi:hypothetical protein